MIVSVLSSGASKLGRACQRRRLGDSFVNRSS